MPNTRPESVSGSKPDPSEWLTIAEAINFHFAHTPRERKIHRSAPYRWAEDPDHPVRGQWFAGRLYINQASLEQFCVGGASVGSRRRRFHRPAHNEAMAAAALDRLHRKHGIDPQGKGGDA